ncbi:MAG TPA: hypothetical protein VIU87_02625, partial [Mycobacterium sp.]
MSVPPSRCAVELAAGRDELHGSGCQRGRRERPGPGSTASSTSRGSDEAPDVGLQSRVRPVNWSGADPALHRYWT